MQNQINLFLSSRYLSLASRRSVAIPSSPVSQEDEKDVGKEQRKSIISKLLPNQRQTLFSGRSSVPTSLSFPNERGIEDYDPEYPLSQIMRETPLMLKKHFKQYLSEPSPERHVVLPDSYKHYMGSLHGETIVHYEFKSDEDLQKWNYGSDSDWGEGYSKCELFRTDRNTAILKGTLSTKVVKDGKTKRAGFCGMKTFDRLSFNRKKHFDWTHFSHLLIKCRGDGRSYKVMLHQPEYLDVTWGDSYSYPLHTHGGPYWQYEKIPFSRFFHTVNGRIQDIQRRMEKVRTSSIGIVLMDRINGDFKLEIGFVGVTHDTAHKEKFAYEKYQMPVYSTIGF